MKHTIRIAELRESIGRRAIAATLTGLSADTRILDVRRVRDVFIVATEGPSNRWASHYVETFRIPTADDTDPGYEDGTAPKIWRPMAGWTSYAADEIPSLMDEAVTYVNRYLVV